MDSQERRLESNDAIVSRLAEQDDIPWYNKPNLRRLYLLMAITCLGAEMTVGFDSSVVNGLQAVPSWIEYYNHPHSTSLSLMTSMHSLGSVAALPFVPFVVDKFGRRYPIFLAAAVKVAGGFIQGSALSLTMFVMARFILGFASVFCIVAASSLIGELSHPKERAVMCSLFTAMYDPGAMAAAAVTLGTFSMNSSWGWRIPSFLQALPSLFQVFFIRSLPESPRWLVSRGRGNEAQSILVKYHAEGDKNSEFVKAEYSQIEETLDAEIKIAQMNQNVALSTPGMRRRVIIATFLALFSRWSGIGLIAFYLSPTLDSIGIHDNRMKNIINLTLVSWSVLNGTLIALIVPRYPRRKIFLASTISMTVVFSAWTIASAGYSFTHNQVLARIVLVLIFLYIPAFSLAFNSMTYTYVIELFPFHARARGITIFQWYCSVGAFVDQFVTPIGIDLAGWKWFVVYCVWNVFQVVFVYVMLPETSGRTLEELTFLYEGEQEAFLGRHDVAEVPCEDGETSTYGAVKGRRERTQTLLEI